MGEKGKYGRRGGCSCNQGEFIIILGKENGEGEKGGPGRKRRECNWKRGGWGFKQDVK